MSPRHFYLRLYIIFNIRVCCNKAEGIENVEPFSLETEYDVKFFTDSKPAYLLLNPANALVRFINRELLSHWEINDKPAISISKVVHFLKQSSAIPNIVGRLLTINTLHNIDFNFGNHPVILRKFSAAIYKNDWGSLQLVWVLLSRNNSLMLMPCCHRSLKSESVKCGEYYWHACGSLHLRKFLSKSKQGNGGFSLHFYPPAPVKSVIERAVESLFGEKPITTMGYKGFCPLSFERTEIARPLKSSWSQDLFDIHFFVFTELHEWKGKTGIEKFAVLWHQKLLRDLESGAPATHTIAVMYYLELNAVTKHSKLACISRHLCCMARPDFNMNLMWLNNIYLENTKSERDYLLPEQLEEHLHLCKNFLSQPLRTPVYELTSRFPNVKARLDHVFIHFLHLVLRNFTYGNTKTWTLCTTGKIVSFSEFDFSQFETEPSYTPGLSIVPDRNELLQLLPLMMQNEQKALRFITCGKRGVQMYAFDALVSVYDESIWCLVLLAGLFGGLFFRFVSTGQDSYPWLSLFKIMVEQGDPFPTACLKTTKAQLPALCFLLVGIVLSNGYKNTNVYRMVTPRAELRYETLDQLIQDGFAIYTRTSVDSDFGSWNRTLSPLQLAEDFGEPVGRHQKYGYDVFSEVLGYLEKATAGELLLKEIKLMKLLANHSRLNPRNIAKEVLLPQPNVTNETEFWPRDFRDESKYFEKELGLMYGDLKECERTALVLPSDVCHDFATALGKTGKGPLSIGKNAFVQLSTGFSFSGTVPLSVFARIRKLTQSGIQNWWEKLLREVAKEDEASKSKMESPRPAELGGNILVVFLVLFSGIAVSLTWLIVEVCVFICEPIIFVLEFYLYRYYYWRGGVNYACES